MRMLADTPWSFSYANDNYTRIGTERKLCRANEIANILEKKQPETFELDFP